MTGPEDDGTTDVQLEDGIIETAAAVLRAVLLKTDPGPVLEAADLSDLVQLAEALDELHAFRMAVRSMTAARAERAEGEVPLSGPVADCDARPVHRVEAFRRGADRCLSLAWVTLSCPAHLNAYADRARHDVDSIRSNGDIGRTGYARSGPRVGRCGDVTDYERLLNRDGSRA